MYANDPNDRKKLEFRTDPFAPRMFNTKIPSS